MDEINLSCLGSLSAYLEKRNEKSLGFIFFQANVFIECIILFQRFRKTNNFHGPLFILVCTSDWYFERNWPWFWIAHESKYNISMKGRKVFLHDNTSGMFHLLLPAVKRKKNPYSHIFIGKKAAINLRPLKKRITSNDIQVSLIFFCFFVFVDFLSLEICKNPSRPWNQVSI